MTAKVTLAAAAVFVLMGVCGGAYADEMHEIEHGKTLPPYGYVEYCMLNQPACRTHAAAPLLDMTPTLKGVIAQVNSYVNGTITAVTDQEQFGVVERWTLPNGEGDCEDYVLMKKQALEGLGLPANALLITVVLDELLAGHAVLTLETREGDFVLDNRRNDILPWDKTNYTFLKRQSSRAPGEWASLIPQVELSKTQASASK
jgi:predicted transglutaminase-like cysteine proteinase